MRPGRTSRTHLFWLSLGLAWVLALSGCGGAGTKFNEFRPKRILLAGDGISYVGCAPLDSDANTCAGIDANDRFTINNTSDNSSESNSGKLARFVNNWVLQLASNYGLSVSNIIEPKTSSDPDTRRNHKATARVDDVRAQALLLPAYQTGDMVVIAGGVNDILDALKTPPTSVTVPAGLNMPTDWAATADKIASANAKANLSTAQIQKIFLLAQSYVDIALTMISTKGQRNIFLPALYDFSASPDLASFCSTPCTANQIKYAVELFNAALITDMGNQPIYSTGKPRLLIGRGYTSTDGSYVNIMQANANNPTYGLLLPLYFATPSVCTGYVNDISMAVPYPNFNTCTWNGIYASTTVYQTVGNVTTPTSYTPAATNPAFISNTGQYIYAYRQYPTPAVHQIIGNTFFTFMIGYNGW